MTLRHDDNSEPECYRHKTTERHGAMIFLFPRETENDRGFRRHLAVTVVVDVIIFVISIFVASTYAVNRHGSHDTLRGVRVQVGDRQIRFALDPS